LRLFQKLFHFCIHLPVVIQIFDAGSVVVLLRLLLRLVVMMMLVAAAL
jgi:hypothetical protein